MKGRIYDRNNLPVIFAVLMTALMFFTYLIRADITVFHTQDALLGIVMVALAVVLFGKMGELKLILLGLMLLSFTHVSELIGTLIGIGEYEVGVIVHMLFFVGILLVIQGMLALKKGALAGK